MVSLNPTDLAQVKNLTDRAYPHLHEDVRAYLNEQLLEATAYWEVRDWLERLEATAQFFEGNGVHESSGSVKTRARRNPSVPSYQPKLSLRTRKG